MQRVPRRVHLMAGERILWRSTVGNESTIDLLDDDLLWRKNRAVIGRPIARSSCSHTLMRRGSGSCIIPLRAKKPPPLTMVASTFLYAFQRSIPPCASIILASNAFIDASLMHGSEHIQTVVFHIDVFKARRPDRCHLRDVTLPILSNESERYRLAR